MVSGLYQPIALLLRYVLAAAGVCIAVLAVMSAARDNRAQRKLFRYPNMGKAARLVVYERRQVIPLAEAEVERSGSVGSAHNNDVVIGGGLVPRHAFEYELNPYGIKIYPRGLRKVRYILEHPYAGDNILRVKNKERFTVGRVEMRFLIDSAAQDAVSPINRKLSPNRPKVAPSQRVRTTRGGRGGR